MLLATAFWPYVAAVIVGGVGVWVITQTLGGALAWWRGRKKTPWRFY